MGHDTVGGTDKNVTKLTRGKEIDNPLLKVTNCHIKTRTNHTTLIDTSRQFNDNLAGSVISCVTGDKTGTPSLRVFFNQPSIMARSYVQPSLATTESLIISSRLLGQNSSAGWWVEENHSDPRPPHFQPCILAFRGF